MKKSVFMIMAAAALMSCSSNEDNNAPVAQFQDDVIRLKSTALTSGVATRSPFLGTIGADNALTALIPSSTTGNYLAEFDANGDATNYTDAALHAWGSMVFTDGNATAYETSSLSNADEARFPGADDDDLYLFGLHPATGWAIDADEQIDMAANPNYGIAAIATFTGSQDIMGAAEVVTTKENVNNANNSVAGYDYEKLTFNHLLTKLELRVRATGTNAIEGVGQVRSITLVPTPKAEVSDPDNVLSNMVTYVPSSNAATFSGTAASMPFYVLTEATETDGTKVKTYSNTAYTAQAFAPTTTATYQAYSMVAPVTASNFQGTNEYYLKIVTGKTVDGSDVATEKIIPVNLYQSGGVNAFNGSTAGYSFLITVQYSLDDILVTAEVVDWLQGGETVVGGF